MEIRNFSSSVVKYFRSEPSERVKYFSTRDNTRYFKNEDLNLTTVHKLTVSCLFEDRLLFELGFRVGFCVGFSSWISFKSDF